MSLPEFFQNLTLDLKNKFAASILEISDYQGDVLITVSINSIIDVLTFLSL